MENVTLIVRDTTLVTMDRDVNILAGHALAVRDSRFVAIGPSAEILAAYTSPVVIDGRDRFVFPGFINTHTHLFQNALKGLGRDMRLFDWLDNSVRKALHEIRHVDIYNAAVAGCLENIRSGVTTVLDYMYAHASEAGLDDAVVEAFEHTGIRGILGRAHTKTDGFPDAIRCPINETEDMFYADVDRLRDRLKGHETVSLALAPGIVWDMDPDGYRRLRQYADQHGLRITMHLDETPEDDAFTREHYGMNTAELLDQTGILGEDFIGAHLVHLDATTLEIFGRRRIKCSHNPVSNLLLASGVAPIPTLKRIGLDVGLGTDGAASNDTQNMLEVIKLAAIVHKGFHQDPTILNAVDVVKMATCEGARVVGREDEIGSLEVGKLADFFLFDPRNVACVPVTDPITCLVYSSNPASVQTVVIHGRIVMQDGVIRSMNEAEAVHALQESAYGLRQRVGLGNTINGRPVDVGPFTRRD